MRIACADDATLSLAAKVFEHLAHLNAECGSAIVAAGGVPQLLSALRSSSSHGLAARLGSTSCAAMALCCVSSTSAAHAAAIAQAGGIPLLVRSLAAACELAPAGDGEQALVRQLQLGASGALVNLLSHDKVRCLRVPRRHWG